jgi:hypothetical protein
MRRRQVLALAAVGLGGCLGDTPGANGTTDGTATDIPPTAAAPTDTTTPTTGEPTDTATDGGTDAPDLRAYPGDCPTYGEDVARVVCSDAAPDEAPLRLTASETTVPLPATVEFTLANDTDAEFRTNHYSARLHKRVDGEWFHVAPTAWPEPLTPLPAGERHTWSVALARDSEQGTSGGPGSVGESTRSVGGLGGGRYAFGNDGWFPGGSYEEKTAAAVTFEVDAPPAALTTTDAVTDVSVSGGTLAARWTGKAGGDHETVTLLVRPTDAAPEVRVVTEQLLQSGGPYGAPLRDLLALAGRDGVERVELTGPLRLRETRVVGYDGAAYRVEREES